VPQEVLQGAANIWQWKWWPILVSARYRAQNWKFQLNPLAAKSSVYPRNGYITSQKWIHAKFMQAADAHVKLQHRCTVFKIWRWAMGWCRLVTLPHCYLSKEMPKKCVLKLSQPATGKIREPKCTLRVPAGNWKLTMMCMVDPLKLRQQNEEATAVRNIACSLHNQEASDNLDLRARWKGRLAYNACNVHGVVMSTCLCLMSSIFSV
jgi:hypothetical protein